MKAKNLLLCIIVMIFISEISEGQITFEKTYGGTNNDFANCVQKTYDGGYVIAGYTNSYGSGSEDAYVVKTDGNGDTLWTRTFGGASFDRANSVQQTNDGGYIIAGMTLSFGAGGSDVYLIKTDSIGNAVWIKTYGGTYNEVGKCVRQTNDGGYIICGYTNSFGAGGDDVYLIDIFPK